LTAWSVQAQSGARATASPTQPDTRFLARIVPPVMTNSISVADDSLRGHADKYTEKDLLFLLSARLQPKPELGELEIEVQRLAPPWKPIPTSNGSIDVQILYRPSLTSQFGVQFEVICGNKSLGTYFANVKARLFREVWVAPTTLKRGTPLDQAGLVKERRDVFQAPNASFSQDAFDFSDLHLTESVNAGAIVLARQVQPRPVMFRNDHVQAVIKDDVMSVSTLVKVLSDGAPGQFVKARNLRTQKEIQGKVIDAHTIEVSRKGDR
jgi:flagella basal body P-ring formation protein FlgA